jgi:hypothetical protein
VDLSEEWIDEKTKDSIPVGSLIEELVSVSLPPQPWDDSGTVVNPLRGNLDAQFWAWNRAANAKLKRQRPQDALEIWSAMYLVFLSLQQKYHHRYRKGMALCNVGYALGKIAGQRQLQAKSWLLGIVEDVLTDPSSSSEQLNFRNALSMRGATSSILRQLVAAIESRFVDQSITPLLPETCIELWLEPTRRAPSEECMKRIDHLLDRLDRSYPHLPDPGNSWSLLQETWGFLEWAKGVIGG